MNDKQEQDRVRLAQTLLLLRQELNDPAAFERESLMAHYAMNRFKALIKAGFSEQQALYLIKS